MAETVNTTLNDLFSMLPYILNMPNKKMWLDYDNEADVLYVNFKKPQHATDSEMTKDGILIRYRNDEIVGYTIMDASKRGEN